MRDIEGVPRQFTTIRRMKNQVQAVLRAGGRSASARRVSAQKRDDLADATLALQLRPVKGYKLNGDNVPWFTTMGGALQACGRARQPASTRQLDQWKIINRYEDRVRHRIDGRQSIGGNSGSRSSTRRASAWASSSMRDTVRVIVRLELHLHEQVGARGGGGLACPVPESLKNQNL